MASTTCAKTYRAWLSDRRLCLLCSIHSNRSCDGRRPNRGRIAKSGCSSASCCLSFDSICALMSMEGTVKTEEEAIGDVMCAGSCPVCHVSCAEDDTEGSESTLSMDADGGVCGRESVVDSKEGEGVSKGVEEGVGTTSLPGAVTCLTFFFLFETHGDPWSSWTCTQLPMRYRKCQLKWKPYHVVVHLILVEVQTFDNAGMVYQAEQHYLRWHTADLRVFPPRMLGNLLLHNKLYCDFVSLGTVPRGHDEAVSAGAKLIPEVIRAHEEGVEYMRRGEAW